MENFEFSNPDKKPLGELVFTIDENGANIKVPALDKRWVEMNNFSKYQALVQAGGIIKSDVDLEEWIFESRLFEKDIRYLLELRHHKFWSHMIYAPTALEALLSFCQDSTPSFLNLGQLTTNQEAIALYRGILTYVVRVICRIITNKESEEEWITTDHLRELIYSNFLISIPMLFDLTTACGESNMKIILKIIGTLFKIEPKYENDLRIGLSSFPDMFKRIQEEAENEGRLTEGVDHITAAADLVTPYDDLALFTVDCAETLFLVLEVFPGAKAICSELKLESIISHFYDNSIPYLYKNIALINSNTTSLNWLNMARLKLISAFRSMIYVHVENILNKPEESIVPSENFIAILTESLSDRLFVIDYQRYYPVEADIDILKQACKNLDTFKAEYILKAYSEESETAMVEMIKNMDLSDKNPKEQRVNYADEAEGAASLAYQAAGPSKPSTSSAVSATRNDSRDFDKETKSILDILPYLGDGFIRRVLSRYENQEEAITAILECNLPPDLSNLDQSEPYIPPDPRENLYQNSGGVDRLNYFDGDEYDIMTNDNPNCIIKQGKGFPDAPKDLAEMLDDKSHVRSLREKYQEYGLIAEDEVVAQRSHEYDDEYDDSYEALLEGEVQVSRPKNVKNTVAEFFNDQSESESEEEGVEEGAQETAGDRDRRNFCENPEDVRARYEAMRNAKYGRRGGGGGGSRAPPQPQPQQKDVVGNAKGQGQDKSVLVNRHKKDVNKSSRGNHNRKTGATWKRSRGMIPS